MNRITRILGLSVQLVTWSGALANSSAIVQQPDEFTTIENRRSYQFDPNDSQFQKLLKERANSAIKALQLELKTWSGFRSRTRHMVDEIIFYARRDVEARLALANTPGNQLKVRTEFLQFLEEMEKLQKARFSAGAVKQQELEFVRYLRIEAALQSLQGEAVSKTPLAKAKTEQQPSTGPSISKSTPQSRREELPDVDPMAPDFVKSKSYEVNATDSALQKLTKERANCATIELKLRHADLLLGRGDLEFYIDSAQRALTSRLELANSLANQLEIRKQFVEWAKAIEKLIKERFDAGGIREQTYERCKYLRLDAEIQLLKSQAK